MKEENKVTKEVTKETTQTINGIVTKVMLPQNSDERITFQLNTTFETIDMNSGEVKDTNSFGLNVYNAVQQIGAKVEQIQLADTLAMGAMVNPQIVALAMTNAEIEIKREFHAAGEIREATNDTYARDCWVTKIINVKPHIAPAFVSMLNLLVTTKPAIIKTAAVPNPFNIG